MKIQFESVTKKYGRKKALDDVSVVFEPGQIIAVMGQNGAGKTTLLRCAAGVVSPDSGRILFDQIAFSRDNLAQRRVFMFLPDFPLLFFEESVAHNLAIILRLYECDDAAALGKVTELLKEFDLLPSAGSPITSLSRGQVYKTALIALLAVDPDVWMLDEPLASGIDPHAVSAFKRHAREATERGRTVIFTTQMLDTAEKLADRACILQDGKIRCHATMAELRAQAADPSNPLEELFGKLRETAS